MIGGRGLGDWIELRDVLNAITFLPLCSERREDHPANILKRILQILGDVISLLDKQVFKDPVERRSNEVVQLQDGVATG